MKILGIDFGEKRVGIAISDENQKLAFPRTVLKNDKNLLQEIKGLVETEGVSKIVIGESKNFKMVDNPIMKKIKKFKTELEGTLKIEVEMFPELLTSHQAVKMKGEKNEMLDASAAAIILQSYLDYCGKH